MRISTVTQNLRMDNSINNLLYQIADSQLQISTGKRSQVYSGLRGADSRVLITLKEQRTTLNSYTDTINNAFVKTKTIDAALRQTTDIVTDMRTKLYEQVQGLYPESSSALQTFSGATITQMINIMNSTADGQYLFSGNDINKAPMIGRGTVEANEVALSGPIPSIANGDTAAVIQAYWQGVMGNNAPADANEWYQGGTGTFDIRIDEGVNTSFGEVGNDDAFEEVFEVLYAFANMGYDATVANADAEYAAMVSWGLPKIEAAFDLINDMVGQNGVTGRQMEDRKEAHAETLTLLESQILGVEDVDSYEAVSRFQTLQSQLQASYQTTSLIRNLSLTNYI